MCVFFLSGSNPRAIDRNTCISHSLNHISRIISGWASIGIERTHVLQRAMDYHDDHSSPMSLPFSESHVPIVATKGIEGQQSFFGRFFRNWGEFRSFFSKSRTEIPADG